MSIKTIIFDGGSGSGKSALKKEIIKYYNFNITTIDRFSPSVWVYGKLRGENLTKEIIEFENNFVKINPLLVICKCNSIDAKKRDIIKENKFGYNEEKNMFFEYLKNVCKYNNVLVLNTSKYSINECVKQIVEKLND